MGGGEYVRFLPPCGILARENKKREKATRLPIVDLFHLPLYVLLFLVAKVLLLLLYLNREKASQTIGYGGSYVSKKAALC